MTRDGDSRPNRLTIETAQWDPRITLGTEEGHGTLIHAKIEEAERLKAVLIAGESVAWPDQDLMSANERPICFRVQPIDGIEVLIQYGALFVRLDRRDVILSTAWHPIDGAQEAREVIEALAEAIGYVRGASAHTLRLIIDTPGGLRSIEVPDRFDKRESIEIYDALHGTDLRNIGDGKVWPDEGEDGDVPPASPDELKAWFGESKGTE